MGTALETDGLELLREAIVNSWTIIEHYTDGTNTVGEVEYSGFRNHDRAYYIGWHHHNGGNRTTLFLPASWQCEVVAGVIFLRRTTEDPNAFDMPHLQANLYTIIPCTLSDLRRKAMDSRIEFQG